MGERERKGERKREREITSYCQGMCKNFAIDKRS